MLISNAGGVPAGCILAWSGLEADIPDGFYVCDGANSTPDLRDRFVVGAGLNYTIGATGGSKSHVHDDPGGDGAIMRDNTDGRHSGGVTVEDEGVPPYYAVFYIMKV